MELLSPAAKLDFKHYKPKSEYFCALAANHGFISFLLHDLDLSSLSQCAKIMYFH